MIARATVTLLLALAMTACGGDDSTSTGDLGAVSFAFDCGLECQAPMDHAVLVGHTAAIRIDGGSDVNVNELTVDTLDRSIAWCGSVQRHESIMRVRCAGLTQGVTRLVVVLDGLPPEDGPVTPEDETDPFSDLPPEAIDAIDLIVAAAADLRIWLDWTAPAQGPATPFEGEPIRLRAGQRLTVRTTPVDASGRELMALDGRTTCDSNASTIVVASPPCSVASDEFDLLAVQPGTATFSFSSGGLTTTFDVEVIR